MRKQDEQNQEIEKLERLQSTLYELKVRLKREELTKVAIKISLDIDKYINRTNRQMRAIQSAKEQYQENIACRVENSD